MDGHAAIAWNLPKSDATAIRDQLTPHSLKMAEGDEWLFECCHFRLEAVDNAKGWCCAAACGRIWCGQSAPNNSSPVVCRKTVKNYGDYVALASKEGEHWTKLTYKQYYEHCRLAAKGFIKLGLERYHGVGILGFNSAEWFISDIGAILAGGFAVGIYTTNSAEACHYVAENCEANILVQDQLPHLKAIIQYKDELKEKRANLYTWAEFMELGKSVPDVQLDQIISSQKPNQCCTLIYTSGTTGQPKGVMLSHDNITWTATAAGRTVSLKEATDQQEVVVSYLPLSHIAAQMIDIWLTMKYGGATYFAQPDALKGSLGNTLKEVRPTAFMGVPRVWEKMQEKMKAVGAKSSTIKRKVATWAKGVGLETNMKRMNGCGKVISGCKTNIYQPDGDGSGEILFWGRHVFMGYLNMEDKTKESIDEEGWLHSGDIGKHDDNGFLYITGRIKGGENIPPVPIEDAIKEHIPIISNVMVVGDKRKFLSMLLTLKCNVNFDTGEPEDELTTEALEFCQKIGSKANKVSDIVGHKDKLVYTAIQEGVNAVNYQSTSNAQKVQKWIILDRDFSVAGGELGPTMKLKRPVVSKMYKDQIDNFYLDAVTPADNDGNQGKHRVTKRGPALSYPMFTLVTGDLGIVGRWRAVCVIALQRPNSDAAAIRIVVGIAAASLCVTVP
ncbi:unnamed protein product [Ranitomeya imitator]|uniref:Long-chain-fatty-acid--CoA ligase ACSBG2 n=1 Tax=Ranitomeya imitator TaxID=111125 RepID=A0ABN9MGA7_9NEOB|nr:unnamed protein product [Ranitomeya imitator]